jgi:hypothetical protein
MAHRLFLSLLAVAALTPGRVVAQALDREAQRQIVSSLNVALKENYVFPDRIPAISAELGRRVQSEPIDSEQFADSLTQGLIKASADLHFSVAFDPDGVAAERRAKADGDETTQAQRDRERAGNFGFRDARRLDGGLAYVRFDFFAEPQYAQETAAAAMRFAEGAKGLIIDLRYNNGGVLEMAQFLMSYLYPAGKEQKFFDYYYTDHGVRVERSQWNLAAVPGQRSADIPVVVLTGSTSFSSAEWMAFSLQRLGRATVIGERTAVRPDPRSGERAGFRGCRCVPRHCRPCLGSLVGRAEAFAARSSRGGRRGCALGHGPYRVCDLGQGSECDRPGCCGRQVRGANACSHRDRFGLPLA